jgi:cytochrome c oxidase assembly factor CtaG
MSGSLRFGGWGPGRSAFRGIAWIVGAIAWIAAAATGAVLAVFFAATVVVIFLMAAVLLTLAGAAVRARRSVRRPPDPNLIEARHIGGHSWVAYGWDGRR